MSSKVSVLLLAAAAISIVNCEVQGFSAPTPRRDVSGVNHFTSIGMPWSNNKELDTVDPMIEFCELVFADFKNIQIVDVNQDSHYQLYASKSGAQLWGETAKPQNGGNACFGGFVPHFQGESRVNVCILTRQDHPLAEFEDGKREDVTPLCRFQSNNGENAKIDENGKVTSNKPGDTHVVVFYDKAVIPVPVIRPVSDKTGKKYPLVKTRTKIDGLVVSSTHESYVSPNGSSAFFGGGLT